MKYSILRFKSNARQDGAYPFITGKMSVNGNFYGFTDDYFEFQRLFSSVFDNPDRAESVVRFLMVEVADTHIGRL